MYRRVVVKIGTGVLSREDGTVDDSVLESIVGQITSLKKKSIEVVLVTSGAVGCGRGLMKATTDSETVEDKQVFAAVGQVRLMQTYARLFEKRNVLCAQVLVTKEDFRDRGHYQNMRRCFLNLLRDGIVPIVNENDVIAIKELVFTDNDELAGLIAAQLEADTLIILTSVDGVLDSSPRDPHAAVISRIDCAHIAEFHKRITREKSSVGRGGMMTKFTVARKLVSSGIAVHIANGRRGHILADIIMGRRVGTTFVPLSRKISGVKRRLAYSEGLTAGTLVVNSCTSELLRSKDRVMSLLPIGITKVEGEFKKGDVVEIRDSQNAKLGFGVSSLDSEKVKVIAGAKGGKAVVHYDYLFIE
ncbi:MAG: glutamate 5-kinase [Patescibacteria group bacterium]